MGLGILSLCVEICVRQILSDVEQNGKCKTRKMQGKWTSRQMSRVVWAFHFLLKFSHEISDSTWGGGDGTWGGIDHIFASLKIFLPRRLLSPLASGIWRFDITAMGGGEREIRLFESQPTPFLSAIDVRGIRNEIRHGRDCPLLG